MECVLLTSDLMLSTSVNGICQSKGYEFLLAGTLDAVGHAAGCKLLLLDLAMIASDDVEITIRRCRQLTPPPKTIVAYGPHVHANKLEAARLAGCDQVMTRGQIHSLLPQLLAELISE